MTDTKKRDGSDSLFGLVMRHFNDLTEKDNTVFHVFDEDDVATQVVTYNDMVVFMYEIADIINAYNAKDKAEEPKEK